MAPITPVGANADPQLGTPRQPDDNKAIMPTRFFVVFCALVLGLAQLVACGTTRSKTSDDAKAWGLNALQNESDPARRAEIWTQEGERLKSEGFTAQALSAFSLAVEENPQLTEAHLGIGDIYREKADYDEADQAYRRAVVSDPNNFDARYFLGLTNQLQGRLKQAIASYRRALRIDPDSYVANRDMGTALLQSGRPDDSILFAKRAVELNPDSQPGWANLAAAYSLVGDYRSAVEAYRQTLELGDAADPVLIGLADAHIKLGNYQRAENVLAAVMRKNKSPLAQERMALVLFKRQKFEQAVDAYGKVLAESPNDTAALNGLGVSMMTIYLRDGEEDESLRMEALSLWRRSLSIRPEQRKLIDLISRYTKE